MSAKNDLIFWGLALGGVYLLYKKFIPGLTGPGSAFDAATSGIASFFPGTSPQVQVQGTVNLPNGGTIPVSSLQSNGFNADGSLNMVDGAGNSYNITPAGNGIYNAQ